MSPPPALPSLSVGNVQVTEGNAPGTVTFTVKLSAASSTPVTVTYSTQNGTATAGSDYTAATGTVTFAPGETTKSIVVAISGDAVVEADETFNLLLSGPSGATLGTATATATIVNDDVAPPVSPPPPPPPSGGSSGLLPVVASEWSTGFVMNVGVKNTSATAWKNWTLEFDADFTITNIWGAEIVSHVGTHYVIKPLSYNQMVAANGGSVTFGFQTSLPPGGSKELKNASLIPVI
jgi:chitinase